MSFATTSRLQIRAVEPSDAPTWLRIRSQYSVLLSTTLGYVVPPGPNTWEHEKKWIEGALFAGLVEVKPEFVHLRRMLHDEEQGALEPSREEQEKHAEWERQRRAVGFLTLTVPPKNRDAVLGIMLGAEWHALGFGTELLQWVVPYAFEQLGMHRLSLDVVGSNTTAMRLYEKVGFKEEGRKNAAIWENGGWVDLVFMAILEEEYWAERQRQ
ncbi:acyl-CoA N-acyltransferase [Calocera viscosa TUFC12733]|uniref:Acyl-CoA N-acyltransferase n=1 Tax=Calocera viscosa (strain TUFC12733) TaxID=1330018 RepID=A0A167KHC0_CALVF|nr:acyl-CoA N-acyltransferase [Calocera viscosa TUFC12733]